MLYTEWLNSVREFLIDQNDEKKELSDELKRIVREEYDEDFSCFMKEAVLNEDYGDLQTVIQELYENEFYIS